MVTAFLLRPAAFNRALKDILLPPAAIDDPLGVLGEAMEGKLEVTGVVTVDLEPLNASFDGRVVTGSDLRRFFGSVSDCFLLLVVVVAGVAGGKVTLTKSRTGLSFKVCGNCSCNASCRIRAAAKVESSGVSGPLRDGSVPDESSLSCRVWYLG